MKLLIILITGISISFASLSIAQVPTKAPAGTNNPDQVFAPGKQVFQPIAIDPALVKQSMMARSEYEDLNRKIIARQTIIYEDNPTIKDLQIKMRDIQKKIDAILANDEELNKLKEKSQSISPEIPAGMKKSTGGGPGAPQGMMPAAPGAPLAPPSSDKPAVGSVR